MQTRTGVRSKLKGLITRNENHSNAGEKLETKELENSHGEKPNTTKTQEEIWNMKTRELTRSILRG